MTDKSPVSPPVSATEFRPLARKPRGFPDRRFDTLLVESRLLERIAAVYARWGFERLETGMFEYADALGKFLPDQDRPNEGVFSLEDDDGQWIALRYDLTAPLARFVAEHFDRLPRPFRRYAFGPVFRNEKPGPGRFREFLQCDADSVGVADAAADAEMAAMACEAIEAAGIARGDYVVKISNRKLLNGLMGELGLDAGPEADKARLVVLRAMDKLDRLGEAGVADLLMQGRRDESGDFSPGAGLSRASAERVLGFLRAGSALPERGAALTALAPLVGTGPGAEGVGELERIDDVLRALGIGADRAIFDASVVRGLEYYTGPVLEVELTFAIASDTGALQRFGAVGGGGRYDDLVSRFRGEPVPATGFSIGVSRLAAALAARDQAGFGPGSKGPVVILALETALAGRYFAMAAELRASGAHAEVYLGPGGMKAQMKYADRRASPLAVIVGSDEAARGIVTLKDLEVGAQKAREMTDHAAWRSQRPGQFEVPEAEWVQAALHILGLDSGR